MHAAHYLRELQLIVRSGCDEKTDSHGNTWVRRDGNLVCESAELVACLMRTGDLISFQVTPADR